MAPKKRGYFVALVPDSEQARGLGQTWPKATFPDSRFTCAQSQGGFVCTRPGHDRATPHVAHNAAGVALATWRDGD